MKLNNKGWGTIEMILLSAGIFLALLIAIFFISKLYGSFADSIGNRHYIDLENRIENAARDYIIENKIEVNGEYKISYETLKNSEKINNLSDLDGNGCNGYVLITKNNGINHYKGYILCNDYQTLNY